LAELSAAASSASRTSPAGRAVAVATAWISSGARDIGTSDALVKPWAAAQLSAACATWWVVLVEIFGIGLGLGTHPSNGGVAPTL
jgi:hypothetical protein